jgi:type IV pilus assembly protein PilY1
VSGIVTVNINGHDQQVPFLIGGGGGSGGDGRSGLGAQRPNIPVKNNKKRTYWYRDVDR